MKAIRVATINSGGDRPGRIRLELRAQYGTESINGRQPRRGYRWLNASYPDEYDDTQPEMCTVAEAMQWLFASYNWPGWGLKTGQTDNRHWL